MPEAKKAITAGQVRARLAGTRLPADPLAVDFSGFHERMPDQLAQRLKQKLRPAGVLIPIIDRGTELSVLLTRRSHDLKHHAGQVSFPGGAMEEHDADIGATALRETYEEVGIPPADVDIAGFLQPTPTITGYAVTPVIGFVPDSVEIIVDPVEVDMAFEVPLEFLLDERNEEHSEREFGGTTFPVVTFHFEGHRIWGATAGMLVTLRRVLFI